MFKYLFSLLYPIPEGKELTSKQIEYYLMRKGYKSDGDAFSKLDERNQYIIRFMNGGLHFKIYFSGYAESDFIRHPITKEMLRKFLQYNT